VTLTAPGRTRRLPLRALVTLCVVAVVLVAACTSWWSRPAAFDEWAGAYSMSGEAEVGQVMNVSLTGGVEPDGPVRVQRIRPVAPVNTADADIELVVCTRGVDGLLLGSSSEPLPDGDACPEVRPLADGADIDWSKDNLVARVTPRRPGTVRLAGFEVTYSRGWTSLWRTDTRHAGDGSVLTVR
jgi:hypothetical protein